MGRAITAVILGTALLLGASAQAAFEPRTFKSPEIERDYKNLIQVLRCLVCQNQNIAESEADLAKDLRDQVYTMLNEGKTDEDVIAYLTARYGDFVLYQPPLKPTTVLLWSGPFLLGVGGLAFLLIQLRRRRRSAAEDGEVTLSAEEQARAARLLGTTRAESGGG